MLYIYSMFQENIFDGLKLSRQNFILKIMKGHNSTKIIDGDWVLVLCISSDGALYLCQVSRKYLERFLSYGADMNEEVLTDGGMDGHSNLGRYNIIPCHFLWQSMTRPVPSTG